MNPQFLPVLKFFKWLQSSFDEHTKGASAKKLTVFVMVACIVWLHKEFCDGSLALEFLIADMSFAASLLGISAIVATKSNKNKSDEQISRDNIPPLSESKSD